MNIPAAETIEGVSDAIAREPAEQSTSDQIRCANELHVANPEFIRDLDLAQFAIAAQAYYFGLKVAAAQALAARNFAALQSRS